MLQPHKKLHVSFHFNVFILFLEAPKEMLEAKIWNIRLFKLQHDC